MDGKAESTGGRLQGCLGLIVIGFFALLGLAICSDYQNTDHQNKSDDIDRLMERGRES